VFNNYLLRIVVILFLLGVVSVVYYLPLYSDSQTASIYDSSFQELLKVSFLDVGQGDAIFVETFDGVQLLIDGGPNKTVLRELSEQMSVWDRDIDIVLVTHTDKDHVGGLIEVLDRYKIDHLIFTENKNDSTVADTLMKSILSEKANNVFARAGQIIELGASTSLKILSPKNDPTDWESNSSSIVAQLRFGDIEFMLTGDAPISIEEFLAKKYGDVLESEVLKLGHHGSRTSTADLFLDTVLPKYALVSASNDNSYGHPHKEVIDKLNERNVEVISTAESGTIQFVTDGSRVWLK
jgi:competence protein ComEC